LAKRVGVSRPTVRQGIQELVDRRLVRRKRGFGTIVMEPSDWNTDPHKRVRTPYSEKTGIIGPSVPDLSNPFFSEIAQIVEAHARQLGYFVLTAGTNDDSSAEIATL